MLKVMNNYDANSLQSKSYANTNYSNNNIASSSSRSKTTSHQTIQLPTNKNSINNRLASLSPPTSQIYNNNNYSKDYDYDSNLKRTINNTNTYQQPNTLSSSRSSDRNSESNTIRNQLFSPLSNNNNNTVSHARTALTRHPSINNNYNDNLNLVVSNNYNNENDYLRYQKQAGVPSVTNNINRAVNNEKLKDRFHDEDQINLNRDKDSNNINNTNVKQPITTMGAKVNRNYLLKMRKKFKQKVSVNVSGTKFEIVKQAVEAIGCKIMPDDNFDCNLIWDDTKVSVEGISELKAFQRYNHFPAMSEISKKDALAKNMLKIYKLMPQDFDFVPKSWIMPNEYSALVTYAFEMKKMQQKRTYIMKPSNGAMGHGIKLYKNVEKIQPVENFIVQEYIANPYLLDGFKFDLRIYALVTSCDPLRAFIYNNGLVRLGTEEYQEPSESNIDHLYMHLTNYSVNKKNKQFYDEGDTNGESGTKRSLKYLFEHLRRNNKDTSKVWKNIQDIILKTLLVAEPYLFHTYKMCRPGQTPGTESVCFEILGFDILLDEKLKAWVIEVNRCPSFGTNQQIDFDIKSKLLINSFELLHLKASDRQRSQTIEKAEAQKRLYNINSNGFETNIPNKSMPSLSNNNVNNFNQLSKRFKTKERRKSELIEQLKLFRREQRRQEIENRNLGNFSRLFPIDDKYDMDYYLNILSTTFNVFYPVGKQFQWKKTYERIKEDKLLNEIAECDEDEYDHSNYEQARKLNEYLKDEYMSTESEEESKNESEDETNHNNHYSKSIRHEHHNYLEEENFKDYEDHKTSTLYENHDIYDKTFSNHGKKVPISSLMEQENIKAKRVSTLVNAIAMNSNSKSIASDSLKNFDSFKKSKSTQNLKQVVNSGLTSNPLNKSAHNLLLNQIKQQQQQNKQSLPINNAISNNNLNLIVDKPTDNSHTNEENSSLNALNVSVFKLLNQLEIKFPGKTNNQTKLVLNKIYSKFDSYKAKLANYWMVKLDDAKRAKILNIVKSNLVVILQKVFLIDSVENLRLFKIFAKLLNRMLWMHGQGLWNCFISSRKDSSSWESIFNKSSFAITDSELRCCHRVVELCKDSVLIVYQYAFEQKPNNEVTAPTSLSNTPTEQDYRVLSHSSSRNKNASSTTNLIKSKLK